MVLPEFMGARETCDHQCLDIGVYSLVAKRQMFEYNYIIYVYIGKRKFLYFCLYVHN